MEGWKGGREEGGGSGPPPPVCTDTRARASKVPARFYSSNLGGTYTDVNFIMMT